MILSNLAEALEKQVKGSIKINELMSRHTTWRIGGPADIFFTPHDKMDIIKALNFANFNKLPITIIGGGSNLLVLDEGIRGIVINLCGLKEFRINGEQIVAQGGVKLPLLALRAAEQGLTGLEFAAGIPGTIGGAIMMNAGAHGSCMEDIIINVVMIDYQGQIYCLNNSELEFSYRSSKLKTQKYIVVETELRLRQGNLSDIKEKIEAHLAFRKTKQPWEYPNAGSVFKNPPSDSAGRLIEEVGAKGWQIGGAQISKVHANFLVNLGGATSGDVLTLMKKVQEEVYKKFNIELEPEILILGG